MGTSAARGARALARRAGSPAGEIPALLPPGRNSSFDYRMDPIPAVGQHNEAILKELGFRKTKKADPAG